MKLKQCGLLVFGSMVTIMVHAVDTNKMDTQFAGVFNELHAKTLPTIEAVIQAADTSLSEDSIKKARADVVRYFQSKDNPLVPTQAIKFARDNALNVIRFVEGTLSRINDSTLDNLDGIQAGIGSALKAVRDKVKNILSNVSEEDIKNALDAVAKLKVQNAQGVIDLVSQNVDIDKLKANVNDFAGNVKQLQRVLPKVNTTEFRDSLNEFIKALVQYASDLDANNPKVNKKNLGTLLNTARGFLTQLEKAEGLFDGLAAFIKNVIVLIVEFKPVYEKAAATEQARAGLDLLEQYRPEIEKGINIIKTEIDKIA